VEAMARGARHLTVPVGETVVREGEHGKEMYVIESGAVEVVRAGSRVAALGAADIFGEIALISDAPRIATVIATEPTSLVAVNREAFLAALATDPAARLAVEHMAHARRRETLGEP
jgi:CRP-like cAMP-binding protein